LLDLVRNVIAPGCLGLALILIARRLEKTFSIEPNQPRREVWLDWLLVISGYVVSYIVLSLITITSGDIVAAFVRFSLGRFVMWINSPQYHRIHHSTRPEHFDKNFASLLPLWDTVFDTAWRPGKDEYPPTGLPDGTKPQSIWEGIIWPVRTLIPKMSFTKSQ
jgi:hypothetical protein